jgi:hypothetical protein
VLVAGLVAIGAGCVLASCCSQSFESSTHLTAFQLATGQSAAQALELGLSGGSWPHGVTLRASNVSPLASIGLLSQPLPNGDDEDSLLRANGYAGGATAANFVIHSPSGFRSGGTVTVALVKLGAEPNAQRVFVLLSKVRSSGGKSASSRTAIGGEPFSEVDINPASVNLDASFSFASGDYLVEGLLKCNSAVGCDDLAQAIGAATLDAFLR